MKVKTLLTCCVIGLLLAHHAWAQERTITGKVLSKEEGAPLPGVSVLLKGTTTGTVTDVKGEFVISVPQSEGGILLITFIGMQTQEVAIDGRSVITVEMVSDVQQLNEVIVTAQGIERTRNELAYAAQQVEGESISKTRDNNFINALSGKVAGVQIQRNNNIGGSTNVVIRGFKSLTGNNQALFVVDGVPIDNNANNTDWQATGKGGYDYGNAAADINPDDIESINVLKGAAATTLYGSRASNGVVLITTKKGRKQGIGVTVNSGVNFGIVDKTTLPKYQNEYGAGYGKYYGPTKNEYFDKFDVDGDGTLDLTVPTSEDASYGAAFDPNLLVYQWDSFDPASPNYNKQRPWVAGRNDPSTFFETATSYINSVSIDGGGDKGYFKLGYTRNEEKGILPNAKVQKNFLNFSSSYEIVKNLKASAAVNFTNLDGRGRYGTGYDSGPARNLLTSFRQWWQTNVDIQEQKAAYFRNRQNITWNWSSGKLPNETQPIYWDNPYWTRYENYETDNRLRYFGNVKLDWLITDWIKATGRISLDSYDELQEERIAVGSIGVPEYVRRNRSFTEYNYDGIINFDRKLTDDLSLQALAGINIRRTRAQSINLSTNGGLVVPRIYALSNSVSPLLPPEELYSDLQVNGTYANAILGLKEYLFLDLSIRRDVSSSLPKGDNAYNYGAASTSFVFSELLDNTSWLTLGKLRLNYAEVGSTAPTSRLNDVYEKPAGFGAVPLFTVPLTKNNDKLRPERTKSYEIGLELAFLNDRVGFDATYYDARSVDQIIPVSVSSATGYASKYVNAGEIQNRGFEVTAFGTPVKTAAFSWRVNVNWTRNRNEVLELFEGVDNLQLNSYAIQTGVTLNAAVGQPYGTIRGTDYIYANGQRVVGTNGRYLKTTETNKIIGDINPDWIGGVANTFKYKNISLNFLVDVKQGGDVYSVDMNYGLGTGILAESAGLNELGNPLRDPVVLVDPDDPSKGYAENSGGIIWPGVKQQGTDTNGDPIYVTNNIRSDVGSYPGLGLSRNPHKGYVYDASYVKLREVSFTYSLPSAILEKLSPLHSVDISVTGRNLWIIHKNLPYADPEDNFGAGNLQGIQVGALPNVRNFGFNLKATF
jgi:TonB-linked SusC/RagA family outer membrane protein